MKEVRPPLGGALARPTLREDLPKIKQALPVSIAIELINLVALYTG